MPDFKLEEHSFRLLKNEPFFAALSRVVTKISNRGIPTAGVCVNPNTAHFELHYNPEFFDNLGKTDENGKPITDAQKQLERREVEACGILKHEFFHLIFEHVTGRLPSEGMTPLWNIACDLAINSEIFKELPFSACVPGREYKDPKTGEVYPGFKDYPLGKSSEYYFDMLKKDPRAQANQGRKGKGQPGQGQGNGQGQGGQGNEPGDGSGGGDGFPDTLDDHSMWGGEGADQEMDAVTRQIAQENLKDQLADAMNETVRGGRGWGSVSASMQQEIIRRLKGTIDWKAVLRYFVKTSQKANRQSSMRHLNRRYPYIHAGRKTSRTAKVAISIDQSGSVSDAMLMAFLSELNKLCEIADFTVLPFDTIVHEDKVFVWKKNQKKKWERVACGGTDFNAPTAYVNEKAFDGHIVLTDMIAPKPNNSKCQRLWMTTEEHAKNPYFKTHERIISIPQKDMKDYE